MLNLFRGGAVGFIDWLDELIFYHRILSRPMYSPGCVPIVNVIGTSTSFHLPGFHRHWLNEVCAQRSSIGKPVDLRIVTFFTEPVFKSRVSRATPDPP